MSTTPSQFETWLEVEVSQYLIVFLAIKWIIVLLYPSHLTYNLSPFLLITFSILNSFWIIFCSLFSRIVPTVSSPLRSLISCTHGPVFFNFLNHKNFFRQIWSVTSCKNTFMFWYSNSTTNFNLGSLSLISLLESAYVFVFISAGFILIAI